MSKMAFLEPKEAEKFEKQKWIQYCGTPCTLQTPFRVVYSPVELSGVVGGWWVANTYIVMPLRGPTCKIARFQAELKFPSWTECGNNMTTARLK